MIRGTERGVLVTRFHYTNVVHPTKAVLTGMTRDGTFWIENGQIAYPVKNLRFTQSILDALASVSAIGRERKLVDVGWACVPALKLERFEFSGTTEF
jgi:PmbA protein